jgi:hypothetical protein
LWRGVRGELPPGFWQPDAQGMVCAVDPAFLSASRNRQTPIDYMSDEGPNVLWALKPQQQSDDSFHVGADISKLSMFSAEEEWLFPPCTMMVVQHTDTAVLQGTPDGDEARRAEPALLGDERLRQTATGKPYLCIDVLPCFI